MLFLIVIMFDNIIVFSKTFKKKSGLVMYIYTLAYFPHQICCILIHKYMFQ